MANNRDQERIKKSTKNATVAVVANVVIGILSFFERKVFNDYFNPYYLGLNGILNTVIGVLSVSELGISAAMAFALYKPIAEGNKEEIASIIQTLRRIYRYLGIFIFVGSVAIIPALPYLMQVEISFTDVVLYFLVFALKTSLTYWIGYPSILLGANQEQYIVTFINNAWWIGMNLSLMAVSAFTQNYLLYTIAVFLFNIGNSITINLKVKKSFPEIKTKEKLKLRPETKKSIITNVKGLILTKLGGVIVSVTDNILTSSLVSTVFLGLVTNYQMITNGFAGFIAIIPNAITGSVGNMGATEKKRKLSKTFSLLCLSQFLISFIASMLVLGIGDSFVITFFGERWQLPFISFVLIVFNFYLTNYRQILNTFRSSLGLFYRDRFRPITEGIFNLTVSFALGWFWGYNGIIIGTILTNLFINLIFEPIIISHYGLKRSSISFFIKFYLELILTISSMSLLLWILSFIPLKGYLWLLARIGISLALSVIILLPIILISKNAKTIVKIAWSIITRKKNKTPSEKIESNQETITINAQLSKELEQAKDPSFTPLTTNPEESEE